MTRFRRSITDVKPSASSRMRAGSGEAVMMSAGRLASVPLFRAFTVMLMLESVAVSSKEVMLPL